MMEVSRTLTEIINSISIIGVYIYQEEGKIVFTNKAFSKILGYSKREILNMTIFDLLQSKEKKEIKDIVNRRLKGEIFSKEYNELYYKTKNGFIKPTLNFGYTIEYNGKPAGLIVVIDTTQQKLYSTLYESLANIMLAATKSQNEDELIKKVVNTLVNVGEFDLVVIGTIDNETKLFKTKYLEAKEEEYKKFFKQARISVDENLPEGKGSIGEAYRKNSVVVINNIYKDERLKYWRNIHKKAGVHSVCSFPINNGKYIMVLYSKIPEIFNKQFLKLMLNIQTVISSSINRINNAKWTNLLNQAINQGFDLVTITDNNLNILYINKNAEILTGFSKNELLSKKLSALFDIKDTHISKTSSFHGIVRCRTKEKREIELLLNVSKIIEKGEEFYIATGKDISENVELKITIEEIINKDQLTGLLNRKAFTEAIDKFIKRAKHKNVIGAVVIINTANFSTINKAFGFNKANQILKQIAERLTNFLRKYDTIAKLESDRFGVLIKDINREEDIFVLVKRLLDILYKSYKINGSRIVLGFSAGISIFPYDSQKAEDLIEKAEIAIPENKGKAIDFGFYRDSLKEKFEKRVKIESEFFKALENRELIFFFQPYIDSANLKLSGAEALIRWKKRDKMIPPMDFIPILEEMGLIVDLESWIIENKLSCIKELTKSNLPIALNISPINLKDEVFVEKLVEKTNELNINPETIRIEITERMFMENIKKAKNTLNQLKKSGFKIMIDDFGTGYSSLSYLANLPLDFVKIDISFIRDILLNRKKLSVVKTIIFMANDLGIKTVAEGVETQEQADLLRELGCNYLQGFYFYKPMPKDEIIKLLKKNN